MCFYAAKNTIKRNQPNGDGKNRRQIPVSEHEIGKKPLDALSAVGKINFSLFIRIISDTTTHN